MSELRVMGSVYGLTVQVGRGKDLRPEVVTDIPFLEIRGEHTNVIGLLETMLKSAKDHVARTSTEAQERS